MAHRLQTLFLTLLLILGLTVFPVFAEEDDGSWDGWNDNGWYDDIPEEETEPDEVIFPDVQPGSWYYKDVMALYDARVIDGFKDGRYGEITDLDVTILRSLVAKIAAKALHLERQSAENFFVDTTDDFTQALYEAGIINGYKDGTYLPGRTLTRAELSAIVHRIYTYREDQNTNDEPSDENSDIQLRTTEKCVSLIKELEGFQEKPYWDYQQYSIGYGSACKEGEYPNGISREEADRLLRKYLQGFEKDLDAFLEKNNLRLSDNQYDALICFSYNLGSSWMKNTKLANLLIRGDYTENEFASAYGVWCHVGTDAQIHKGLITRRIRELQMFFDNDYTGSAANTFYYVIYTTDRGELETDVGLYRAGSYYDPLFSAECEGDTFLGWFTEDGVALTERDVAAGNVTVSAAWQSDYGGGFWDESGDYWP